MYQYKYIKYDTNGGTWFDNMKAEHRAVIDEQAAEGWRYVGYIPTMFGSKGDKEIDMIFEKWVDESKTEE